MKLQCELLLYLDKNKFLDNITNEYEVFFEEISSKPANRFIPFRYALEIDVMKLLDEFPDLGKFLLEEPLQCQRLASEILFSCLKAMDKDGDIVVKREQVTALLRLTSVPKLLIQPNQHYFNGLVSFTGTLLSVSKPSGYVYHTVWSCPEECEGNEVILSFIPKAPPKCSICRSVLFENSATRRCGDHIVATFVSKGHLLPRSFILVDDLIQKAKIGLSYVMYGVAIKKNIMIWSIEPISDIPTPKTLPLSKDIRELQQSCKGLPWTFIYCLASTLGVNICPLNCFMHLKISLLMSLSSIKANKLNCSNILHVMASGLDSSYVGDIMNEASKLADISISLGTTNTDVSTALSGSIGGVCVLQLPLRAYKQKHVSAILNAIESNQIITETSRVKLQTAIWAYVDSEKNILNVANVFGFVCRGDDGEYNEQIVDFILQNSVGPTVDNKEETKALKDLARYIDVVSGIDVRLNSKGERLLRSYFLAARKDRPRGVTVGNMEALVTATITSARLCRRDVAGMDDAVFAIWLHVCGSPEPRCAPDEYLQTPAEVKKLKKIMNGFKQWLEQFTGFIMNEL